MDFPPAELEVEIVAKESQVQLDVAEILVRLGQAIRRLDDSELGEVASTRTLVAAATLITNGLSPRRAAIAAIAGPLTDDKSTATGLQTMAEMFFPE